jgi:hypothetical protein|tara:strand:- start:632 stop:859 length:228 start_codon:yes stop_codon:yes gene_type:complete
MVGMAHSMEILLAAGRAAAVDGQGDAGNDPGQAETENPDIFGENVLPSMQLSTTSSTSNAIWSPAEHSANSEATR